MKKTTFTLLFSLSCCWLAAQCPTGNITFSTQGQIDSFPINYPGCTHILGSITIKETSTGNIINLYGVSQIDSIGGYLNVQTNVALISLNGLDNLTSIGGGLFLDSNGALMSLSALSNLTYVGGGFYLNANVALTSLDGLDSLISIGGTFIVTTNYDLTSLSGLDNLTSVGGYLLVNNNIALTSLNGLGNLISIDGYLAVSANYNLMSLSGLDNIDPATITQMTLQYNPQLSVCDVQSVCTYLENGGPATISNNAPGCNSVPEIEAACIVSIDETSTGEPVILFSPNPASDFLQIQIGDSEKWEINLFDLKGRQMFRQVVSGGETIWVKDWPSGIYALRAVSGGRVFSGKIVKQ